MNPSSILIIGDIAGQYKALLRLIRKSPKVDLILAVGDLVDRGPDSNRVIEYFMRRPKTTEALLGNHEQMMYMACQPDASRDDVSIWYRNGGLNTVQSYGQLPLDVTQRHIKWISKRPLYYETDDLFVSHAPVDFVNNLPDRFARDWDAVGLQDFSFIWNRYQPVAPQNKFMVHGHNSVLQEYYYEGKMFGMCIDNSRNKQLVGLHWPSKEVFTEPYNKPATMKVSND